MAKYEFSGVTKERSGIILRQVRAIQDFGEIKAGDVGGFIQHEHNLSQSGLCWLDKDSICYGDSKITSDAFVANSTIISSKIGAESSILDSFVCNSEITGESYISNSTISFTNIRGNVKITRGTYQRCKIRGNVKLNQNLLMKGAVITEPEV